MNALEKYLDVAAWIVALEDKRFFEHKGIDWLACVRAAKNVLLLRPYGGASTIDMQYVRTITNERTNSISRKLREMRRAHALNQEYSKSEILESYLTYCFVSTKYYSIAAVYRSVIDKYSAEFEDIDLLLACMVKYPMPASPSKKWYSKIRARYDYGLKMRSRKHSAFQKLVSNYLI